MICPLFVIFAIDERLDDIRRCIASIRDQYGDRVTIALSTYGTIHTGKQPECERYAKSERMEHAYMAPQSWLTDDDLCEWHCSETMGRIQTMRHYSACADEICMMHSDVVVIGNCLGVMREYKRARKCWSFIAEMINTNKPYSDYKKLTGWGVLFNRDRARIADIFIRYNNDFIEHLYDKYKTDEGIWEGLMKSMTLLGDLTLFDLGKNIDGYESIILQEPFLDENKMFFGTISHRPRNRMPNVLPPQTRKGPQVEYRLMNMKRRGGTRETVG